jgi:hypothetical protein
MTLKAPFDTVGMIRTSHRDGPSGMRAWEMQLAWLGGLGFSLVSWLGVVLSLLSIVRLR